MTQIVFELENCITISSISSTLREIARHPQKAQILGWIRDKVSIKPFFKHFKGSFKGELFDSDEPLMKVFKNNVSCKPFVSFVEETLVARLKSGAISLLGRVGVVDPPFIVLPLTVEPTKPRLCHDARYLNLWMRDMPFSLDRLIDLPRYVGKDTYQTVLDDKSGYDHILLSEDSRTYFGIQRGGWYFTYNTLPFWWKISPFVYHTTGLLASNFLRAAGIPCLLYTMANCRWHSIRGNTLLLALSIIVTLRRLGRLYFLLLTTLSDWAISLVCQSQYCSQVKWFPTLVF